MNQDKKTAGQSTIRPTAGQDANRPGQKPAPANRQPQRDPSRVNPSSSTTTDRQSTDKF